MRKLESIDYWYYLMTNKDHREDKEIKRKMFNLLRREYPLLCSLVLERSCNLNCLHCFFQKENSSEKISHSINLGEKIISISSQLPINSSIIHEGRILRDWHIPILKKIKEKRKDVNLGIIDNGSFVLQKETLKTNNLLFDWIDISIDGLEKEHNMQRQDRKAFAMAINGLKEAKKYIQKNGKITSLFTATSINHQSLLKTFSYLTENQLIDELHVTPASKSFSKENDIAMNHNNWEIFWKQLRKTKLLGDKRKVEVYFRIYKPEDLISLSKVVSKEKIIQSFTDLENVLIDRGSISFLIDGIRVTYISLSICPSETFLIDADGKYRLPYCIEYTLEELNQGKNSKKEDISHYTIAEINSESSFKDLYKKGVKKWVASLGLENLKEEVSFFRNNA